MATKNCRNCGSAEKYSHEAQVGVGHCRVLLPIGPHLFGKLDRSSKGVVTTQYGEAVLARGRAAFDELRQGIRDIEFIADPQCG